MVACALGRTNFWDPTVTVTSIEDKLCDLDQIWLPSMSRFLRIRVDFVLACVTTETMFECFRRVAALLLERALSLQFLEVRIGYSHANASAAVRDHGFALVVSYDDVANSMRELVPLLQSQERRKGREYKPLQITWGVSEAQRMQRDYSCACTYLSASFLQRVWSYVRGEPEKDGEAGGLLLAEEDCRPLGCRLHHH